MPVSQSKTGNQYDDAYQSGILKSLSQNRIRPIMTPLEVFPSSVIIKSYFESKCTCYDKNKLVLAIQYSCMNLTATKLKTQHTK